MINDICCSAAAFLLSSSIITGVNAAMVGWANVIGLEVDAGFNVVVLTG